MSQQLFHVHCLGDNSWLSDAVNSVYLHDRRYAVALTFYQAQPFAHGAYEMVPVDEPESQIVLRLSRSRKGAYVRAARPGTLSAWIFRHLDAASGFDCKTDLLPKG